VPVQISAPQSPIQAVSKDQDSAIQVDKPVEKPVRAANDHDNNDALAALTANTPPPVTPPDPGAAQTGAQAQLAAQLQAAPPPQAQPSIADDDSTDDPQVAATPGIAGNQPAAANGPAALPVVDAAQPGDTSLPAMPKAAPRDGAPPTKQALQAAADPNATAQPANNQGAPQTGSADPAALAKSPAPSSPTAVKTVSDDKAAPAASGADKPAPQLADLAAAPQAQPAPPPQPPQQPQPPAPAASVPDAVPVAAAAMPLQAANNAAAAGSIHLSAPSPGAAPDIDGLAVAIAARSQSGAKQFAIRLDPPELGQVEVRLSIDAGGKAQAHMTADRPETLNLLQKDSGTLTQALRDAGLDVSHDGLNFSLRSQSGGQGQNGRDGDSGPGRRANLIASRVIDSVQSAASISSTGGDGRLDIHV
jgi:flagellar hook-length control protein FliK